MVVIGLTGGIGAGKSVVARVLRCKGFAVYDCDLEAKRIMEASGELKGELRRQWGDSCIRPDGSIARDMVAMHVFGDDDKRRWLNSKVHTLVREDIRQTIESKRVNDIESEKTLFFVESAILNTSRLTEECDCIWLVEASEEVRLNRAMARDCSSIDKIACRMRSQQREFEDFGSKPVTVFDNNDDSELLKSIELALQSLK